MRPLPSSALAAVTGLAFASGLCAACGPKRSDRRSVALQETSAGPAVAVQPSQQHSAGPWYQRRGAFPANGPAARPIELWRVSLGDPITQPLTTDGGAIFAVAGSTVHSLTPSGERVWASDARAVGPVAPMPEGPAVATEDGVVLMLDAGSGRHGSAWSSGEVRGLAVPLGDDVGWVTADGVAMGGSGWRQAPSAGGRAAGGPASTGDRLLFTTTSGALVAATAGEVLWEVALPGPGVGHPATNGEVVVTAYGQGQGHSGGVAAFRVSDGEELWRWGLSLEPAAPPALGNLVLVADLGGQLNALDVQTGELIWRTSSDSSWSTTPAVGKMGAYATEVHGRVTRIDLDDGGEVWSLDLRSAIAADPVLVGDMFVVGLANGDVVALAPRMIDRVQ